jgi:hypothetical protein
LYFDASRLSLERNIESSVWNGHHLLKEIYMRSKLILSVLVVASLVGATALATAQTPTQPAPGASSEGNVGPGATNSKMKPGSTVGSGMNKGMVGSNKGDARNPSGQGNVGPGTDNNAGKSSGGK